MSLLLPSQKRKDGLLLLQVSSGARHKEPPRKKRELTSGALGFINNIKVHCYSFPAWDHLPIEKKAPHNNAVRMICRVWLPRKSIGNALAKLVFFLAIVKGVKFAFENISQLTANGDFSGQNGNS